MPQPNDRSIQVALDRLRGAVKPEGQGEVSAWLTKLALQDQKNQASKNLRRMVPAGVGPNGSTQLYPADMIKQKGIDYTMSEPNPIEMDALARQNEGVGGGPSAPREMGDEWLDKMFANPTMEVGPADIQMPPMEINVPAPNRRIQMDPMEFDVKQPGRRPAPDMEAYVNKMFKGTGF